MEDPTHIYCDVCREIQPLIIDALGGTDVSGVYTGTDLVCKACKLIITTVFKEVGQ